MRTLSPAELISSRVLVRRLITTIRSRNIVVGLTNISTPGAKTGTVTIDNTDLTTGGCRPRFRRRQRHHQRHRHGPESCEWVLFGCRYEFAHSELRHTQCRLRRVAIPFSIRNLTTAFDFTALLDLLTVGSSGRPRSVLTTNLAAFTNLAGSRNELVQSPVWTPRPPASYSANATRSISPIRVTIALSDDASNSL